MGEKGGKHILEVVIGLLQFVVEEKVALRKLPFTKVEVFGNLVPQAVGYENHVSEDGMNGSQHNILITAFLTYPTAR